jgi:hypothetical protein
MGFNASFNSLSLSINPFFLPVCQRLELRNEPGRGAYESSSRSLKNCVSRSCFSSRLTVSPT